MTPTFRTGFILALIIFIAAIAITIWPESREARMQKQLHGINAECVQI